MYKVLWEATREGAGEGVKSLLSAEARVVWEECETVRAVNILRNHLFHDKNRGSDASQTNQEFLKVGRVYQRLCGASELTTESQYQLARANLVSGVLEVLGRMLDAVRT
jgi:hypothetical protein